MGQSVGDEPLSAKFEGKDTVKLDGLEALVKAVKMKPPTMRVGILGKTTARNEAQSKAQKFAKNLGKIIGKMKSSKQVLKEGVKAGKFGATNAVIGAAHEFGSLKNGLPRRSFLRDPLIDQLQGELEKKGAFSEAEQKEIITAKSLLPWAKKVCIVAETIVRGAFDTNGYGRWPALKEATLARKTTKQTLVETTQLRDSIVTDARMSR